MTPGVQQTGPHHNQPHSVHGSNNNNGDGGEFFHGLHSVASTSNEKMNLNMADIESKLRDAPDKYLFFVAHYLAGHINDTDAMDRLNGPILKGSIKSIYWIFVIQYALLAILGIVMNIAIIAYVGCNRLFRDVTQAFIANLALCHVIQCAIVLPITLMVMLIQNWIFGQFLCFFLPMLQDIPLHVAMMTHILIAWDRMRWLSDPLKCRLPAFVCSCATWLTGMVIALPYPIYTIYVEIGDFLPRLHGVGLCVVNLMDDMHEYMRGLFFLMYCAPSILLAYIYIKTSQELRPPEGPLAEYRAEIRMRQRNSSASSVERSYSNATTATAGGAKMPTYSTGTATRTYDLYNAELDLYREKWNQRTFGGMAAAQIFCICPLMILRFVRLSLEETYENQKHFDYTYLMFVWIAFLPTIIFPLIYATQFLSRTEQKRLRDYFRLSAKRLPKKMPNIIDESRLGSSRENSIEKDESTNISQRTSIILNGDSYVTGLYGTGRDTIRGKVNDGLKAATTTTPTSTSTSTPATVTAIATPIATPPQNCNTVDMKYDGDGCRRIRPKRERNREGKSFDGEAVTTTRDNGKLENLQNSPDIKRDAAPKRLVVNNNDLKVSLLPDGDNKSRQLLQRASSTAQFSGGQNKAAVSRTVNDGVDLDAFDNWSFSQATASTYCNGTASYNNDDADTSNFGDCDDSSIVSGVLISDSINGSGIGLPPYSDNKKMSYADFLRSRDASASDFSSYSCMNSSSTLKNEMDKIDILERKRNSMEKGIKERRRLPNVEKFCYRSPKPIKPRNMPVNTLSAKISGPNMNDTISATSTLTREVSSVSGRLDMSHSTKTSFDEEVPSDYYDDYNIKKDSDNISQTTTETTPVKSPVGEIPYQYCRRSSRKSLHHHLTGSGGGHRLSKRDGFNSLQSNDLIAGAFGELDPTQPLSKMSVIENRVMMRRSSGAGGGGGGVGNGGCGSSGHGSGRSSNSFMATGRSSLKSRDFGQNSHSTQPELDFRENIFAEL